MAKEINSKKSNKKIQDAHEAIRPTDVNLMPEEVKDQLPRDLFRLYQLIWRRFVASRMENSVYETTNVKVMQESIFLMHQHQNLILTVL